MRKSFSFILLLFLLRQASAQDGAPLLTHFREKSDIEDQSWAITQDDNKIMLFANRKGILSFDGEEWSQNRFRITPFAMSRNPVNNKVYIGGENDYGYIERDHKGTYRFISLCNDTADLGIIDRIIFSDSLVCFFGERTISCLSMSTGKLKNRFYSKPGMAFTGMFNAGTRTFINVAGRGLFRVESDTLFPIVTGYLTEKTEILFSLPYSADKVLLGMSNGRLELFDGIKYYDYKILDEGYILNNVLSEGTIIGDSLYAFSTIGGGAVVAERKNGKVRTIINNQKGLPDDEIFAMGTDESGGLWLSHPLGLTRADLNLPVGNFSIYPGLKGNLAASLKYNNELYVATSEGVFYLAYEKSYSEVEVIRRSITKSNIVTLDREPAKEIAPQLVPPSRQANARKNIFTKIFGKKNTSAPKVEAPAPKISNPGPSSIAVVKEIPESGFRKETVRKLKSIDYLYKKVAGLNDKCRQLVPTPKGLLAATNRGLYVIIDHKAIPVSSDRYINYIGWTPYNQTYPVAAADGYFLAGYRNGNWSTEIPDRNFTEPVYSIVQKDASTFWLGGENAAFRAKTDKEIHYDRFVLGTDFSQRYFINNVNDSILLLTETGVSVFDETSGRFVPYKSNLTGSGNNEIFTYPVSNIPLIGTSGGWVHPSGGKGIEGRNLCLLKLFDEIVSVYCENNNIWIVDKENRLFGINCRKSMPVAPGSNLIVRHVRNEKGTTFDLSDVVFERGDNVINFEIIAPAFLKQNITEYQYYIEKIMTEWSGWSTQNKYSKAISKPGEYTLLIRSRNMWGDVGETVSLPFVIKAPFTQTTLFFLLVIIFFLAVFLLIVRFREKQFQEKNALLEDKVRERTAQIEAQKEEITSSIEYASRIQMAMLPVTDLFSETFSEYFILFKPRDIVSGDFYWIGQNKENIFLTVADCTGHGVPGAFMSTLGISALNEIITHNKNLQANAVLNLLREKIKTSLHQTGKEGEAADGMDISLCIIDRQRKKIQFSGAYNPLYVFNNGDIKEYKADRMPIGIHYGEEPSFTNYEINVSKGDVIYLLSDGLTDQFGGPEGNKFKKAYLKKLLTDIHFWPLPDQKNLIEKEFLSWKGKNEQVDDITVVGVKI
jgi:serine phosphatase RsbU (regulator of sigma subunit)